MLCKKYNISKALFAIPFFKVCDLIERRKTPQSGSELELDEVLFYALIQRIALSGINRCNSLIKYDPVFPLLPAYQKARVVVLDRWLIQKISTILR